MAEYEPAVAREADVGAEAAALLLICSGLLL